MRGLVLLLAAPVASAAQGAAAVSVEPAPALPHGWTVVGPSHPETAIELTFAVKQQNLDKLHDELMRVSDPRSDSYGQHLSNEEVHALTAPTAEHRAAVHRFLKSHGLHGQSVTPSSDFITAVVPAAAAGRMLSSQYVQLEHKATGAKVDRAISGYHLPEEVAAAVDFVSPAAHIPGVQSPVSTGLGASPDSSTNEPKTLRQLYNVGDAVGKASSGNKQAVTAFLGQFYSEDALKTFYKDYCSGITCGKDLPKLVGDATSGEPGVESMLDIEYITGVGGGIETEFWGFSGTSPDNSKNEPFMKWLTQVSNTSDATIPKLFSTSYGEGESTWSPAAAQRLNAEFMKAGARGITLLFASGDSGATCSGGKFHPNMPASSPYVTSVGGTQPADGFPKPGSESAIGLSSGGFSNYWGTPAWQKDAVEAYFKQPGLPSSSTGYNASGRGFPDISAQATNFCVTPFGCGVAGTSAASPTAAGIFGLLNDLRFQSGKAPLGYLNPLIYQNAAAFNDVTSGSGSGCIFGKGWPATKGWDAVTGLGTPDYQKLAKVVVADMASETAGSTVVV